MRKKPGRKRSIFVTETTERAIAARGENFSGSVRAMVAIYDRLIANALRSLPERRRRYRSYLEPALNTAWDGIEVPTRANLLAALNGAYRRRLAKLTEPQLLALYDLTLTLRSK